MPFTHACGPLTFSQTIPFISSYLLPPACHLEGNLSFSVSSHEVIFNLYLSESRHGSTFPRVPSVSCVSQDHLLLPSPLLLLLLFPIVTHTRQTTQLAPDAVGHPSRTPPALQQGVSPSLVAGCTSHLLSHLPPSRTPCSLRPQISQEGPSPPAHRTALLLLPDPGRCKEEACSYGTQQSFVTLDIENAASLLGIQLIMFEVKPK